MSESRTTNYFLTNFATGYKEFAMVADFVAPGFPVLQSAGKYGTYGKSVNRIYNDKVSKGEKAKEIRYDVSEATYNCEEYDLKKAVYWADRRRSKFPMNLDLDAAKYLKRAHHLSREYRVFAIAGSHSVVTNYTDKNAAWATAASGTPYADILAAMSECEDSNGGFTPNRILIPSKVALKMSATAEWMGLFKYSDEGFKSGLFNVVSGLRKIGLEPMITNLQGSSGQEISGSDPTTENFWGDTVLLFYCEPTPSLESRTFMYSPYTFKDRIDSEEVRSERCSMHYINTEIDELLVDAYCAYLIEDTI